MKKLNKLVLGELAKKELSQREQNNIRGGLQCTCGCCYTNSGGSSDVDNQRANCDHGLDTGCSDFVWWC
jgi:natural product precursor